MRMGSRHLVVMVVVRWRGADPQRAHRGGRVDPWIGGEAGFGNRYPRVELMGESVGELSPGGLRDGERHWTGRGVRGEQVE